MDAPFATVGFSSASPRTVDHGRVPPAPISASSSFDQGSGSDSRASLDGRDTQRSVNLDPDTGSLVYRMIDVSTGAVRSQTPTDARLQLRAYIDTVIASEPEPAIEVLA